MTVRLQRPRRLNAEAVAAWCAIGAGCAGLVGLLSTLPWPELFSIDATPRNAVVRDPGLLSVLVGHYAVLAAGGVLGLLAGLLLGVELRRRRPTAAAALLVAVGSGTMGYAAMRKAINLGIHDGRSTLELESFVWAGGGLVLVGAALLSIALRHAGRLLVVLGLASPVLVSGGVAVLAVFGPDLYPAVWGLTFPPPSDYLLATWFIVLGWLGKTGQLHLSSQDVLHHRGTRSGLATTR